MTTKFWFSPFKLSNAFQDHLDSYGIKMRANKNKSPVTGDILIYPELYRFTSFPEIRHYTNQNIDEILSKYQSILELQDSHSSYSQSGILQELSRKQEPNQSSEKVLYNQYVNAPSPINFLVCRLIFKNYQSLLDIYSRVEAKATNRSHFMEYFEGTYQNALSAVSGQDLLNDWWDLQRIIHPDSKLSCPNHDLLSVSVQRMITIKAISELNNLLKEKILLMIKHQTRGS
ncbi:hypothetical protein [Synechococcus sp. CC9616]|uniref:hypothetical protein n=1 Tax=Synechococcus sp. CC9616 TaxID=110663 RepID=UPI0012EB9E7C|nr:hypothetical protein [Synechococcus sp. CC9616]